MEISFTGEGPRHGTLIDYKVVKVDVAFKDRAQLKEFVSAVLVNAENDHKTDPE